jgi:predicted transcriptional regulator
VVRSTDEFNNLRKLELDDPRTDKDEIEVMNKLLSSDVKLSILELFHNNPGLIDRLEGVALRIGRNTSEVEKDAKDLLEIGILQRKKIGNSEVICFDVKRDGEIQELISNQILRGGD